MCGIAGYLGFRPPREAQIQGALATLRLRGPDRQDHAVVRRDDGRTAVLLHTRLSILDLDPRADQPFVLGTKTLVYNGELYNYLELRRELEAAGWFFRTDSDTEVLLVALSAWGFGALDRFEGMWAFALYDATDGSLLLCRDRFGQKPLCLVEDERGLWFGSEPKAIFALRGAALAVNRQQLCRYLVNGYKSLYKGPETFFAGLRDLPPGHFLHIGADGRREERAYWRPACAPDDSMGFEEAVAQTRTLLIEAVERHLRADVPIAFCMSGGVDSNTLIATARRALGYDVHGFTIGVADERYDEREAVAAAVRDLGVRHTEVQVMPGNALQDIAELIGHHDAPVYTISYYLHWRLLQQIAGQGYRISISGTGADELFSGYYDHYLMHLRAVHGTPCHARALEGWRRHVQPVVRNPHLGDPDLFVRDPGFRDHIFLKNEEFRAALAVPFEEGFSESRYAESLLRNRMMNELFHEGVPVILHEDDLNAMSVSVENRSPFLERPLFEFCATIPDRLLMRDGYNKAVLRAAMRGIVPDAILDQPRKVGFNAPVESFIDVQDPATRAALLEDGPIFSLVRREAVEAMLGRNRLANSDSKFLFYFVNAKLFLERYAA